jgi:hypothetical protein
MFNVVSNSHPASKNIDINQIPKISNPISNFFPKQEDFIKTKSMEINVKDLNNLNTKLDVDKYSTLRKVIACSLFIFCIAATFGGPIALIANFPLLGFSGMFFGLIGAAISAGGIGYEFRDKNEDTIY